MNLSSSPEARVSLRDKFRAATREAILEAAAGLLNADGAVQIRMEDIAARAGIAVGTLYNYFEDRTSLVTALLETRTRSLFEALEAVAVKGQAAPAGRPESFTAELRDFIAAVVQHVNTNRFLFHLLIEDERHNGLDARVLARRQAVRGDLFVRTEVLMQRGIASRALRPGDAALYAAAVIGMVQGIVARALVAGEPLTVERQADIVSLFMTGAAHPGRQGQHEQ